MPRIRTWFNASLLVALFASALSLTHAQEFQRTPLANNHPFVGIWRIELPQLGCFEQYQVRADGTRSVIAGQERSESEFSISSAPDERGYFKWTDKIVRSNGKPDCTGSITPVGDVATIFLLFHRTGDSFLLCVKQDPNTCIGPYVRSKGSDA